MRILIFGAGAIGSLFGGLLAKKYDVTLIGRKKNIEAIRKEGLKIYGCTKLHSYPKALLTTKASYDFIILAVKSYDTLTACQQLKKIIGKSCVLSIQNGLNNEILVRELGRENVLRAVTTHGAFVLGPGKIYHAGIGKTIIGELNGKLSDRVKELAEIFNSVGIETKITKNIFRELWLKVIINACINPLTSVIRSRNGVILTNKALRGLAEEVCREAIEVANKVGNFKFSYNKVMKKVFEVAKATKNNKSSMLQDLEKGKRTEIDFINGKIVELGRKLGLATSTNSIIVELVDAYPKSVSRR